jgi:hypothetical protein
VPSKEVALADARPPLNLSSSRVPLETAASDLLGKESIANFLKSHWGSLERADLDKFVSDYDQFVHWYNEGLVSPDYIRRQKTAYLRNWEQVSYRITGPILVKDSGNSETRLVSYPMKYEVANGKSGARAHGIGTDFVGVHVVNGALKIFSEDQELAGH